MDYQVLPLKYRPQTLDELWIQEHIKTTLKKAIKDNRVAHAYLFAGPRGVGKTTTARILAKSLNCVKGPTLTPCQKCSVCQEITNSQSLDVIEIDGASNRGIDQIRELRENIKYLPTACPYKIYIIDEVHMLTEQAFNALLKTLEEPPKHVKFIFATTAPHKVPSTILSRCQRFDFHRATVEEIVKRLQWIAEKENIKVSEEALFAIGKRADGSIRDAESILDQLRAYKPEGIELKDVEDLLGIISSSVFFEYTELILTNDSNPERKMLEFIDRIFSTGYDFMEFFSGLLEHFRLLLMVKLGVKKHILGILPSDYPKLAEQAQKFSQEKILAIMKFIADNENEVKRSTEPKILFEILSLRLLDLSVDTTKCLSLSKNEVNAKFTTRNTNTPKTTETINEVNSKLSNRNSNDAQTIETISEPTSNLIGERVPQSLSETNTSWEQIDVSDASALLMLWQCLISELKNCRPYLAQCLAMVSVDKMVNNTIILILDQKSASDHKDFIEQEKSDIERRLSEMLKKPIRIALQISQVCVSNDTLKEKEPLTSDTEQVNQSIRADKNQPLTDPEAIFKSVFPNGKRIK
ncbi:MAG: DNA polymerase III subunit gamma/tau [candidate division WOR-3 bacterium]|nr:DNA polymerase III subunit gamma/tau [candidate division WOR-3 bacterium]